MENFREQIAQVTYRHADDSGKTLAQFYGIEKLPLHFPLEVNIDFLNIEANKNYLLLLKVIKNTTPLQVAFNDTQVFSVPLENMILVRNGLGQSFIKTAIDLKIDSYGEYKITIELQDETEMKLSSFSNYYYFGGLSNE